MASSLYQNPFYQGMSSLGSILTPDPSGQVKAMQAAQQVLTGRSQAGLYDAQAGKFNEEATDLRGYREGRMSLADAYKAGATPEQIYANSVLAGDNYYKATPGAYAGYYGTRPDADPNRLANIVVGIGGNYANTQPGFSANQSRLAQEAAAKDATDRFVAGLVNQAAIYGHDRDYDGTVYSADKTAQTSLQNNILDNETMRANNTADNQRALSVAELVNEAAIYGHDRDYDGTVYQADKTAQTARINNTSDNQRALEIAASEPEVVMINGVPTVVRRDKSYGQQGVVNDNDMKGIIRSMIVQDPTKMDSLGAILSIGEQGSQAKPPEFTSQEVGDMMSLLPQLIPGGEEAVAQMPPELRNQLIGEVAREYQRTGDFASAVASVVQRIIPAQDGWFSDTPMSLGPAMAPQAVPQAGGASIPPPPPGFVVGQ